MILTCTPGLRTITLKIQFSSFHMWGEYFQGHLFFWKFFKWFLFLAALSTIACCYLPFQGSGLFVWFGLVFFHKKNTQQPSSWRRLKGAAWCEEIHYSTVLAGQPSQNVALGICRLLSYLILAARSWTRNEQGKTNLQPPSCDRNILRFCLTWQLLCI